MQVFFLDTGQITRNLVHPAQHVWLLQKHVDTCGRYCDADIHVINIDMDKFRKQEPVAYRYDEGAAVSIVRTPAGPGIWQMA